MQLSIITPEKILIEAEAQMVTIPGTEGEFGVLDGHAPFISTIRPGVITIDLKVGGQRKIAIVAGIAEAVPDRCTVLAESAEECTGQTPEQAQARLNEAKAQMDQAVTDAEKQTASKKLALAEAAAFAA